MTQKAEERESGGGENSKNTLRVELDYGDYTIILEGKESGETQLRETLKTVGMVRRYIGEPHTIYLWGCRADPRVVSFLRKHGDLQNLLQTLRKILGSTHKNVCSELRVVDVDLEWEGGEEEGKYGEENSVLVSPAVVGLLKSGLSGMGKALIVDTGRDKLLVSAILDFEESFEGEKKKSVFGCWEDVGHTLVIELYTLPRIYRGVVRIYRHRWEWCNGYDSSVRRTVTLLEGIIGGDLDVELRVVFNPKEKSLTIRGPKTLQLKKARDIITILHKVTPKTQEPEPNT